MSVRLYINIEKLPQGWSIGQGFSGSTILNGVQGQRFVLSPDGAEWYLSSSSEEISVNVPESVKAFIDKVSMKISVSNLSHMDIIDSGEHYGANSTHAIVVRNGRHQIDFVDVTVVGKKPEDVTELYYRILRGRQADEPYYKITSFKRWLQVRFWRFCRRWASMNAEMRGEAN